MMRQPPAAERLSVERASVEVRTLEAEKAELARGRAASSIERERELEGARQRARDRAVELKDLYSLRLQTTGARAASGRGVKCLQSTG